MSLSVASLAMALGLIQLLLAALGVPGFARWNWFAGGMLFWGCSLFLSMNVH